MGTMAYNLDSGFYKSHKKLQWLQRSVTVHCPLLLLMTCRTERAAAQKETKTHECDPAGQKRETANEEGKIQMESCGSV